MLDEKSQQEEKAGVTPETIARRQAARRIGRIVMQHSYQSVHPEATAAEVKEAISTAKADQSKTGRQVLKALEKSGLSIRLDESGSGKKRKAG